MTSPTQTRVISTEGLTEAQRAGERCAVGNCRRRLRDDRILLGSLPDGSPVFACPDHDLAEVMS